MIDILLRRVLDNWAQLYPGSPPPTALQHILQSRRRVIFFLFAPGQLEIPLAVIKLSRHPAQNEQLEKTVSVIRTVRGLLGPPLEQTVPRTISLGQIQDLGCIVESALPGDPMRLDTSLWRSAAVAQKNVRAFATWLERFQKKVSTGKQTFNGDVLLDQVLLPLERGLAKSPSNFDLSNISSLLEQRLQGLPVPLVWSYGDTHHSNFLMQKGQISGAVDWEGAAPKQWPWLDWFQFVFQYAVEFCRKKNPAWDSVVCGKTAIDMLLARPEDRIANILQRETTTFISHLGYDRDLIVPLFITFLARLYWPEHKDLLLSHALAHIDAKT
ncbi:MAG: phosphotransferase [Chloroflexia bacterium]|nr:phosphotransferase [Chloroflexia bacterium]